MATFTQDEIDFLKAHGNDECGKTWLGLWDPKRAVHQDQRELMVDKYERKRYYLEPASPLKSLANAVSLKSNASSSSSAGSELACTMSNAFKNGTTTTDSTNHMNNVFHNIRLTPPAAPRAAANGAARIGGGMNDINRPQQTNGGAAADNNFGGDFNSSNVYGSSSAHAAAPNGRRSVASGFDANDYSIDVPARATKASSAKRNSPPRRNGFATNGYSSSTPAPPSKGYNLNDQHTNGYAKVQPIKVEINGNASEMSCETMCTSPKSYSAYSFNSAGPNGSVKHGQTGSGFVNGQANSNGFGNDPFRNRCCRKVIENFADFDGAPVFKSSTTENFANFDSAPIHNPKPTGLPIPTNGMKQRTLSASSNGNNNNNGKLSSTPSEDRYAALKDLDEQLRESKAAAAAAAAVAATVVDSFGNGVNSSSNHNNNNNLFNGGNANPFKSLQQSNGTNGNSTNPMLNPFQGTHSAPAQNLFGQLTVIPNGNGMTAPGFASPSQQQQQQQQQQAAAAAAFYNGLNGATAGTATVMYPPTTLLASGPSGCGFGFGAMQQQIAATGGGSFNNPFAATGALNSNNPFL